MRNHQLPSVVPLYVNLGRLPSLPGMDSLEVLVPVPFIPLIKKIDPTLFDISLTTHTTLPLQHTVRRVDRARCISELC